MGGPQTHEVSFTYSPHLGANALPRTEANPKWLPKGYKTTSNRNRNDRIDTKIKQIKEGARDSNPPTEKIISYAHNLAA